MTSDERLRTAELLRGALAAGSGPGPEAYVEAALRAPEKGLPAAILARAADRLGLRRMRREVESLDSRLRRELPIEVLGLEDEHPDCGSCGGTGIGQWGPPDASTCSACRGRGERR